MKGQAEGTFNRMRKFRITEISGVAAGAMGPGSNIAIIKRHSTEQVSARSEGQITADDKEETMTNTTELDLLKADNLRLKTLAELSDSEKTYLKSLTDEKATAFLSATNRAEIVKNALDANPVVGTFEGKEIRKSDDPLGVLTSLIQKSTKDALRLKQLEDDGKRKDLEKRAGELKHLAGTVETKIEILKALDSIENAEVRKSALATLIAKDASASDNFQPNGTSSDNELEESSRGTLDTITKVVMAANKGLTYEQAYTKALLSDEGKAAYNQHLGA